MNKVSIYASCHHSSSAAVDLLEVVEVVKLWGGQEGEVVSAVGNGGADQSQAVPQGGGGQMRAEQHRSDDHGQHVGDLTAKRSRLKLVFQEAFVIHEAPPPENTHHMLQRMSVGGNNSDRSGPLMVLFVVMLVEAGMVEQPDKI